MKTSIQLILIIMSLMELSSGITMADEAQIPNNFQSGTPAFAEEVNENFSAVKTAVDDNFSRINEKQNRITGTCPPGESIRVVNDDGTVVCEADSDSGGDITAVAPGSFISGGGQTGSVKLSVSGMPGVEYATKDTNTYLTTTDKEIFALNITAPTNGFVMAIFNGQASLYHYAGTDSSLTCWISLTGNQNATQDSSRIFYIPPENSSGIYMNSLSTCAMIRVVEGTTTIYVMGKSRESDTSQDARISHCSFNLLFFPARY